MEDRKTGVRVDPNGVCRHFVRVPYSLEEEMDTCDVCRHYDEDGSLCLCPQRADRD